MKLRCAITLAVLTWLNAAGADAACKGTLEQTLAELGRSLPATTVTVNNITELLTAVQQANSNGGNVTILLKDGDYPLTASRIAINAANVAVRSVSGNRDAVRILGNGMFGGFQHGFEVAASYFTLADVTVGEVRNHPVKINGESNADYPLIHNVRIINAGEQMLKVTYQSGNAASSDGGIVEGCEFEYAAGIGPQFYIGGVDAHQANGWIVRDNVFKHIRSPDSSLAEHAIHFWSESRDTLVERNVINDCDRGIGFGLGSIGHVGGIIRNNMVRTTRDVGIGLESSEGTLVLNNTVLTPNYSNAIEYRFARTSGGSIINNLTDKTIAGRDGGTAVLSSNVTNAQAAWFVNAEQGDLHLTSKIPSVVNHGQNLPQVTFDIDCDPIPPGASDIGADQWPASAVRSWRRWDI